MEQQLVGQLERMEDNDDSPLRRPADGPVGVDPVIEADAVEADPLFDVETLTRQVMHDYHLRGRTDLWDSLLCRQTVWLGSGASMMFGGESIRNHFREFVHFAKADILIEEYHTLRHGEETALVFGDLITRLKEGPHTGRSFRTMFSITYGVVEGAVKILMQHYSFEWQGEGLGEAASMMGLEQVPGNPARGRRDRGGNVAFGGRRNGFGTYDAMEDDLDMQDLVTQPDDGYDVDSSLPAGRKPVWQSPQMKAAAFLIARNLSVGDAQSQRVGITDGGRTLYIDPRTLIYAESRNHGCEVVTLTKAFFCHMPLGELAERLPNYCCRVHRGYLVNAHYITVIRRSELELASGVVVPIPVSKYVGTRRMLNAIIERYHR